MSAKAQEKLNEAACLGELGFNPVTGRAYLDARVLAGDQDAQQRLNSLAGNSLSLRGGRFNRDAGRAYLETRASRGDQHAQEKLNDDAEYHGRLGFDGSLSGFHELLGFSDRGGQISVPWFFDFYNAISGL